MTTPGISTPVGRAPIIPVIGLGVGAYLLWFGVHYFEGFKTNAATGAQEVIWPTDPVKAVLQGKPLSAETGRQTASGIAAAVNAQGSAPTAPATPQAQTGDTGVAGGTYTHATLMNLWTLNGGSTATANIAAAIAMAESGGRSNVTSNQAGAAGGASCINVGLWQLATCGKGAGYTIAQLQDPDTNARLAVFGSVNGTDWSAWETYANGAYKQYLS